MWSFILIFLAGSSEAFMDTFLFRVDRSVFKKIGIEKLSPMFTWKTYKPFLGWMRLDPWHIAKTARNVFFYFAIILYVPVTGLWDVFILPICWFCGFELFWSKILYKS